MRANEQNRKKKHQHQHRHQHKQMHSLVHWPHFFFHTYSRIIRDSICVYQEKRQNRGEKKNRSAHTMIQKSAAHVKRKRIRKSGRGRHASCVPQSQRRVRTRTHGQQWGDRENPYYSSKCVCVKDKTQIRKKLMQQRENQER